MSHIEKSHIARFDCIAKEGAEEASSSLAKILHFYFLFQIKPFAETPATEPNWIETNLAMKRQDQTSGLIESCTRLKFSIALLVDFMWNVPISMRLVLYVRCLRQVLLSGLSPRCIPDIGTVTGGMSEIRFFLITDQVYFENPLLNNPLNFCSLIHVQFFDRFCENRIF